MFVAQRTLLKQALAVCDALTLLASCAAAYMFVSRVLNHPLLLPIDHAWLILVIIPTWMVCLSGFGFYRAASYRSLGEIIPRLAEAHFISGLVLLSTLYVTRSVAVSRLLSQVFLLVSFVLLLGQKVALKRYLDRRHLRTAPRRLKVLLVGSASDAQRYVGLMRAHALMLTEIVGMLSPAQPAGDALALPAVAVLGTLSDFRAVLGRGVVVDEVVVVSRLQTAELERLSDSCATRGVVVRFLVEVPPPPIGLWSVEHCGEGAFLVSLSAVSRNDLQLLAKRLLDIVGAVPGLVLFALTFLLYARRLRAETGGQALFSQQRIGRSGRRFTLYKFRTMCHDAEARLAELKAQNQMKGPIFKLRDDPRVTPTGLKLRRRHLDELPEFWNVFKGDMSLVGTRPPTEDEVAAYRDHHHRRLSMKPGLTGLWQLSGNGKVNDFEEVVRLDCQYIDDWSLWLDFKIIARTVAKVLRGDGW